MRIILAEGHEEAVKMVAETIIERLQAHPNSVLGLATGKTMIPVYEEWRKMAGELSLHHDRAFFFLLDEYLGISPQSPSSFRSYINKHLLLPLNIRQDQVALPEAGLSYEQLIKESGGIDLQLLGIGQNGHIGFNEPGSLKTSRTRTVKLSAETMRVNSAHFDGNMPEEAISMGVGTILESKAILMLATGESKAAVIKHLFNHHDDPECPATYLKGHPHFTLVLDPAAASKINLKI